jgi:adenosylhomocysteine nucleosidase
VSSERQVPGFVIAATGLRTEARIATRSDRVRGVAGGGDAVRLEQLIQQSIAEGGQAIISFGIAGGLTLDKAAGTCLVGSDVVHNGNCYRADAAWAARIGEAIGRSELVRIAGIDQPVTHPSEKQALHEESNAVAADMESHIVARLAAGHGLRFAVLRVISDPGGRGLPPAALAGMGSDGTVDFRAVIRSVVTSPGQLPALIRVAADTRRGMASLIRCQRLLGPCLGLPDLD